MGTPLSPISPYGGCLLYRTDLRISFAEAFVVCRNYTLPKGFKLDMSKPLLDFAYDEAKDDMRFIAPFVAAGDLS